MCGVSGILSLNGDSVKFLDKRINLMTQILHHRGPDQQGIYISKKKKLWFKQQQAVNSVTKRKISITFYEK